MKKIRNLVQSALMLLALGAAALSTGLHAEDIDIYLDNATEGELPNVLFVLDNSSNVASSWGGGGCAAYADGSGAPSLGTNTAGGVIQCALVDTINTLPDNRMKVGIMSGNANNFGRSRGCVGDMGGCLLYELTTVDATSRPALISFIKAWKKENSGETATSFPFTVTSAPAGAMMQESWAYYNGATGMSGRSYSENLLHLCQKNFIIYLGNTDKSPANEDESGAALAGVGGIPSASQSNRIRTTQVFNPAICGSIGSAAAGSNSNDWSYNWSDEWSRFMFDKDGGTSTMEGSQNITTYTIGIIDNGSNQCTASYPALLQSMAVSGGGKAYRVSDAGEVKDALAEALNEVQAVNSVFSSASLPVSVNAEGSYLNQIFLGMFRPDSSGAPRWLGNLKQYQLIRNGAGQLVMGDACTGSDCPKPAITSGGTGFLAPGAVSFWTYRDDSTAPDLPEEDPVTKVVEGGFFRKDKQGTPESGYDLPDGEVVEKGGVAQQLRKQSLKVTFEGASGTSVNPRRVYTFCPHGGTDAEPCQDDLRHADNDFSTANTKIAATTFGATVTVPVVSIVRTGTTALVTTKGNHGFTNGSIVTIRNAAQPEYNKTQVVTVNSATTFTITGLPDYPTSPSTTGYTISVPGTAGTFDIESIGRSYSNTTGSASETVTVTTKTDHPYLIGQTVFISGVSPASFYGGNKTITATPTTRTFQFSVPIYPVSPPVNAYQAGYAAKDALIQSIDPATTTAKVVTKTAHGFHTGQSISISNVNKNKSSGYNGTYTVTVENATTFWIARPASNYDAITGQGAAAVLTTPKPVGISREGTSEATRAIVTGAPAKWFANGDTVTISTGGSSPNESAYVGSFPITCLDGTDCTRFAYSITAAPVVTGTVSGGRVSIPGAGETADIPAGNITRTGGTAKVVGVPGGRFLPGSVVEIQPTSGTVLNTEAGYVGSWQIDCGADTTCSSFTFGAVPLTPATPATPASSTATIQAYSSNTAPDKNMMIKWLRGHDNQGDEKGPGNGITVRPSIHGDVLHSRPLVINYGDSRGIVVFYGSNDGVYRAVNGNQTASITTGGITVPAGGELWGLILPEHYQLINRYRSNSPELQFPGTFLSTAQPKDYFVDGPTGVYQKLRPDGKIDRAIIYLTMRRGGRFLYAIDVTEPAAPRYLWSISHQTAGFEELGQTWSRPRVTLLQKYKTTTDTSTGTSVVTPTPVLVFGAGYDPAQDEEPPTANTMGRGIFVVDAVSGAKIFSASASCPTGSDTCRKVDAMKHATPSDIAFVDRDLDGYIDKFYWGDLGGNLWRADVADADVANWSVTRVAALGCNTGECSVMTAPRKFFFPPAVLSVRAAGAADSYDLLSIVSGDREHPLRSDSPNAAFNVKDRFFMVKDLGTSVNVTTLNTTNVTADANLVDATYSLWDGSRQGFYISFIGAAWGESTNQPDPGKTPTPGEKAVNAPVAVNGQIFFSTNQPKDGNNTCQSDLGTARAYAVNPFTGGQVQNELAGGGLPPSAVSGLISITETDSDGNTTTTQEKFCIGCGVSGKDLGGTNEAPCTSALENCNIGTVIPKNLKRTYWYKK